MNPARTRMLFVGDMHLGTRPSRIPAAAGDGDRLGPAGAWERAVDAALEHRVHAVALAGDVVNSRNALFEAGRPLDRGLMRLADAGIPVLAVAGNHDTTTLPAKARGDDRIVLLGPGGTWSAHELNGPGGPTIRVVGWSFPRAHHDASPLAEAPPAAAEGLVTFGLLHCDRDQAPSVYAPVTTAELAACGYDGWFLGHVHTPEPVPAGADPFYLGSLVGLDPTETGVHGPVLVTVAQGGTITRQRLPLAPLRWERVEIDCGTATAPEDDLQSVLEVGLRTFLDGVDLEPGTVLGVRVVLIGEVERPAALAAAARDLAPGDLVTEIAGVPVFVDRVTSAARGRVDLAALARGDDPPGLLARRILLLEGKPDFADDELLTRLLEKARAAVVEVDEIPACRRLGEPLDEAGLRRLAAREARGALADMLAAVGGAP